MIEWYYIVIIILSIIIGLLVFIMVKIQLENNSHLVDIYNKLLEIKNKK